jgi:integrase/recombinase XerD
MYEIIRFYVEADIANKDIQPTTAAHKTEVLERVFQTLVSEYGVSVYDDRIEGLTPPVLQRWFINASKNWKPATCNSYVNTLNPFFRWAAQMEYMKKDLSGILKDKRIPHPDELPENERPKNKYYTHEQVHDLLWGHRGRNIVRDRAMIGMLLYCGLRVSELCSLTIGQVMDVPRGSMRIKRKGGAWCDVEVADEVYPLLEAYLKTRKDTDDRSRPLFMTSRGVPCNRKQVYKALAFKQEALDLATGPHALRHTAISEISNTYGSAIARDFANHKSLVVTNRYSHTSKEQRHVAVNALPWAK